MKSVLLLALFPKYQFCVSVLCCLYLFLAEHSLTGCLSTVSHIPSWHRSVKFFSFRPPSNILSSIHPVQNAQIFLNLEHHTSYSGSWYCSHDDYVLIINCFTVCDDCTYMCAHMCAYVPVHTCERVCVHVHLCILCSSTVPPLTQNCMP
jgi:hypothetical protein